MLLLLFGDESVVVTVVVVVGVVGVAIGVVVSTATPASACLPLIPHIVCHVLVCVHNYQRKRIVGGCGRRASRKVGRKVRG